MKKLSLILASVALFDTVANAQTETAKTVTATTETKAEVATPKAKKAKKAKVAKVEEKAATPAVEAPAKK